MPSRTDRSLQILSKLHSLESVELSQCPGITDAGIAHLATLPNLKKISMGGLANVTPKAIGLFGPAVRVNYDV
ncbi:hypothetical protein F183_A00270 [Bryobacterales bacterium F-183]|nr:hypothetical protein F183_A00270 [Bryobacterales bacterium F-183]